MKIIQCQQQTPEWYQVRCGIPSASNFEKIITTKGEPSKQAQKYMYKLAGEKVCGIAEESYQNGAMLRGVELEAEAREFYELINDVKVEQVGFCMTDDETIGCSPDGLVGDDGLIEIKCPSMAVHVEYMINDKLPADYFQQVQGGLFVTGRKWSDFVSYYPGIKPFIIRVERDEDFISSLDNQLKQFCEGLNEVVNKIK